MGISEKDAVVLAVPLKEVEKWYWRQVTEEQLTENEGLREFMEKEVAQYKALVRKRFFVRHQDTETCVPVRKVRRKRGKNRISGTRTRSRWNTQQLAPQLPLKFLKKVE